MVNMKNRMLLSTLREIKNSLGRFIAILAIVALGVGFFGGLKTTKPSMIATLESYLKEKNFFDLRLISTIGFDEEDVRKLKEKSPSEAVAIEPSKYADALCSFGDGSESAYRIYSLPSEINQIYLMSGRMPENAEECLIDDYMSSRKIGNTLTITDNNEEDTLDSFVSHELTVVGTIRSPLYVNYERGTTSVGTGSLGGFVYVLPECFDTEYFTEVYVKLNSDSMHFYTDEYDDYIDEYTDIFENLTEEVINERYASLMADANKELSDAKKELEDAKQELEDKKAEGKQELDDAKAKIEDGEKEIADNEILIEDAKKELLDARDQLRAADREYEGKLAEFERMKAFMPPSQAAVAEASLKEGRHQIDVSWTTLKEHQAELKESEEKLEEAKEELADGKKEYEDGLREYDEKIAEAEEKIADAEVEIADAEDKINDISNPSVYVLDRNTNIGYACFDADSNIVESVSNVFPVFFFLVAVLICMTTMNRMIEERRTEIGIYKALGFSQGAIMFKFMFYACSASITGAILGYALGMFFMPQAIWQGYNIMYNMGHTIKIVFLPYLAVLSIMAAILCAAGSVYFSVIYELREVPANLIRPKAPKIGKRVFLEYITPIWNRMKFLHKVSVRNVLRYKKRFFMMVVGISGCTALVITGFGIGDSIKGIATRQYENIQVYDVSATFSDDFSTDDREELTANENLSKIAFLHLETADLEASNGVRSLNVVTPESAETILQFLVLQTPKGEKIPYPTGDEGVVSAQIAEILGINAGDTVTVRDSDMNEKKVRVTAICENYVYNYIFMPEDESAKMNTAWMNAEGDVHNLSTSLSKAEHIMNVNVIEDLEARIDKMMKSMDFIVLIVILCAGALAFIVVYNLTNINITERIREIATIKVLGFYPNEAASYVFRENMILTGIGAIVGLPLGKLLHSFIMFNIKIEMVSFKTYVAPLSYVLSIAMTFGFALLVNFLMYFKLQKINMAESLKSIE